MSLLGIDIGSGSCKGVAFDYNGSILASANYAYATYSPGPEMVEIEPEIFWTAVVTIIRQIAEQTCGNPVEALAVSSHGETYIPVGQDGKAVGPGVMNSDNRATEQSEWWDNTVGKQKIYEITGVPLHPMFALNKIMWLKKHRPDQFEKTQRFLSVEEFILGKLGLYPVIDFSLATRTMAFDIRRQRWSEDILAAAGLPERKLGSLQPAGTVAGKLTPAVCHMLSLPEGVTVAVGGHDQPCGALGAGAINPGEVSDSAGTYECITAVSERPANTLASLECSLNSYCHVVPNRYVTLAFFPAGLSVRWFVEQFCTEEVRIAKELGISLYDILNEKVESMCSGPTGVCMTPHMVGSCNPHWDVRATGVIAGVVPGITKYHMYKAIFEGIAFEMAENISILEKAIGDFEGMAVSGGNASSAFTVQLRADITNKRMVTLKNKEAVCLGSALLAGVATGVYTGYDEAVKMAVTVGDAFIPDSAEQERYQKQYRKYRQLYPALEGFRGIV
ncbi:MAG: hypothetical protein RHS_4351 [Robinsoniella sp. RHS]|uniref:FGGY-family carbohydrate kinase n=1 Tax=Robinsoniella TaxID=588605 RepID=UPI000489DE4B|nr:MULTISPECIES: FGGY-family carbohydrate kinase [Robinsoniella]KLU69838.1 MAG: hypothetical protein RHS_4351 [Robinsoniella sp. RHS]